MDPGLKVALTLRYNDSELKEGLEEDSIPGWPRPDPLPHDDQDLMKPYALKHLSKPERVFNYRLSRARRVVENTCSAIARWYVVNNGP